MARQGREVDGILLLDKPEKISSNNALQEVKRIYNANRAGHTGTLDPLASGVLPICFGKTSKFAQNFINADKRYRVIAKLGQRTSTFDADGEIIEERSITFTTKELEKALDSFLGKTLQIPPMYSSLKYQGRKLYKYARQGIEIPRKARPISVYDILIIQHKENELELEVWCSKGTYIRSFIDELGEKLGCGAHVIYLRRLAVSRYQIDKTVKLEYLYTLLKKAQEQGIEASILLDPLLISINTIM